MYKITEEKFKKCRVYKGKKMFILGQATQQQLKDLYERKHPGIEFIEQKKEGK